MQTQKEAARAMASIQISNALTNSVLLCRALGLSPDDAVDTVAEVSDKIIGEIKSALRAWKETEEAIKNGQR